jgi:hypothetical protein
MMEPLRMLKVRIRKRDERRAGGIVLEAEEDSVRSREGEGREDGKIDEQPSGD